MDPSLMATAVSRSLDFLFRGDSEKKQQFIVIWIIMGFCITFCIPIIGIAAGMQMLQDRISELFSWADLYSGLFDQDEETIDQAFERWFQNDYPRLQELDEDMYPSLDTAYGISFYYQVTEGHSLFDEGGDFISIFLEDDPETAVSMAEDLYGIDIPDNQNTAIASLGDSLSASTEPDSIIPFLVEPHVSSGNLAAYPENTYYTGGDSRASAIWNEAFHIGGGNPFYGNAMHDGYSPRQCTTFAWYRFYQYYGYDCRARSDGRYFASSVVNAFPDRFVLTTYPAAGAIVSFPPTPTNSHGHVGFVEKVEGEYMWYSEGNYDGGGIRINTKVSISSITRAKCGNSACIYYAVPR